MLHHKCTNGLSNKAFDEYCTILQSTKAFLDSSIPKNYYEAKKQIRDLGVECIKIDVCPNDCMLYWKDNRDKERCDACGESRWISGTCQSGEKEASGKQKVKRKVARVLRWFPLIPRLQRYYMDPKTAEDMIWHDKERTKDGVLRHPADSQCWKTLDEKHRVFGSERRNVRLGLASDGFNSFGVMGTGHSTWPVFVTSYNLSPEKCMKQPYFIMFLLIPGPKGPGNNIDVYLQPLIGELKELWEMGIETYDAYSKQNFQMRATLLWTINDFPAYTNLSGWRHRRFLPIGHPLRRNLSSFNGRREHDSAPKPLSGEDVLRQFRGYHQITFGKEEHAVCGEKRRRDDNELPYNWKKISIFFELPYWKDLLLRHNIDVMHTEKNNSESWIGTLLNIEGKTKDNLNAREDLKVVGIRGPLHPEALGNNKFYLPPAKYTLSLAERRKICQFLRDIKVPDSYSSNISRHVQVQECKIPGLKSHDWHVLMQQLFLVAVRGILHDDVTRVLVEFSDFYTQLCSKTLRIEDLEALKKMYLTLCKMEMIFPPSFFDIMTHLPVHIAREAIIAGPVHYRWMYPIERYLYTLKKYVRNKSQPEGSIAQGYLADECLTFFSRYLSAEINTKFNQIGRNSDGDGATTSSHESPIFEDACRSLGKPIFRTLSDNEWEEARMYVLSNCDEILPFIE
ncbi:uncharacterized protein LOC113312801 [Papaver somniferum]|uniref:uncharacterized protein LOC113312801 n=1 Tax=Papaver somniferum TaxID=3469 RepID=UPI000E6F5094|nr:uncharacterized protein LOC113312801 [Papaver somniferum]